MIYLWGFILISIYPAVTIFEVTDTYIYPLLPRLNWDGFLTSMDTINCSVNRHFSYLPAYRQCWNASIWVNTIYDISFYWKIDFYEYMSTVYDLEYHTVKSRLHIFKQFNEATKNTLKLFNEADFIEWRCRAKARQQERKALLLMVENLDRFDIDILHEFIKNSSNELQRNFNWMGKDNRFYDVTPDKKPKFKYTGSEKSLYNRVAYPHTILKSPWPFSI